jgi:ABC-2 type transport system ATP-binding protein
MDEAEQLADQVVIVDAGKVIAEGSPEELCRGEAGAAGGSGSTGSPDSTVRFRARSGLDLGSLLKALPEGSSALETAPGSYRVEGTVDPQLLATLTSWCAQAGIMPDGLAVERRTLEDVFLDLTGRDLRG